MLLPNYLLYFWLFAENGLIERFQKTDRFILKIYPPNTEQIKKKVNESPGHSQI